MAVILRIINFFFNIMSIVWGSRCILEIQPNPVRIECHITVPVLQGKNDKNARSEKLDHYSNNGDEV